MDLQGDQVQVRRLRAGAGHQPLHVRRRRRHAVRQLVGRDGARPPAVAAAGPRPRRPPRARPAAGRLPAPRVRADHRRRRGRVRGLPAPAPVVPVHARVHRARQGGGGGGGAGGPRVHHVRGAGRVRVERAHAGAGDAGVSPEQAAVRGGRAAEVLAAAPRGVLRQRHRADQRGVPRGGAGALAAARCAAGARRRGGRDGRLHAVRGGLLRGDARAAVAGVDAAHHGVVAAAVPRGRLRVGPARGVRPRGAPREGGGALPAVRGGGGRRRRRPRPAGAAARGHGRVPAARGRGDRGLKWRTQCLLACIRKCYLSTCYLCFFFSDLKICLC
uniref:Uncharacterized protein n=1 Tax=Zea mays TaxID=4577 RepID=A0A804QX54_MAIZE